MFWLLIIVIFVILWMVESFFGWMLGGQLRQWLILAVLIYFGLTIKKLKSAQEELQNELKRLWKVIKIVQANATVASDQNSKERPKTAEFKEFEPTLATQEDFNSVGEEVIWSGSGSSISLTADPVSYQTVVKDNHTIVDPAPVQVPPDSRQDEWLDATYRDHEQTPNAIEDWLAGGNWIVRGGLAILFIGLVFLAKFAYENALLPLELRLAAIAGFAVALLVVGWRSRIDRPAYGLSLQGGGVAVLYLTIFATGKLTSLLPPVLAMALMLLVAVLAAWLAILQDAMVLAVIGTIGGFMAPVLMSTGQGSHVALFSYFAALNTGILTVALRKAWRPINVLAFFFSFGISGMWGMQHYQLEYQLSCMLFLILFFAMFVLISALFTRHQSDTGEYDRAIDATLLFGVPTATFGYGLFLLKTFEYGGAWLAVMLSAIYLLLAYFAKGQATLDKLKLPWAALSLLFATLAVPLAFDARLTSSIWVLEGAAVISYAWQQRKLKTRCFGYLLVLLGTIGFMSHWPDVPNSVPIFNALTIGLLVLALGYGVIGWSVNRVDDVVEDNVMPEASDEALSVSWIMAVALAFTGGLIIVTELYLRNSVAFASIAIPVLLWGWALALQRIAQFTHWPQTVAPCIVLPLLTLLLPIYHSWIREDLNAQGLIYTAIALIALLLWQAVSLKRILPELKNLYTDTAFPSTISAIPGFTLVVFWLTILVRGRNTWSSGIIPETDITLHGWFLPLAAALPVLLLWWLSQPDKSWSMAGNCPALWRWLHGDDSLPDAAVNKQRRLFACLVLVYILATTLLHSGQGSYGMSYFPVLNLYELVAMGGLLALLKMFRNTQVGVRMFGKSGIKVLSVLAFVFANSILSRILANFFHAEFAFGFAWHSAIAATTYSIIWTLAALVMMWLASNKMKRSLWITGALLLAVVAIKLLMIDLSKVGSLARIISFIGVGVLMLVVGYVAPIPSEEKSVHS